VLAGKTYAVSVTPLVKGNGPVSIRLHGTSADGARYLSTESSRTRAPRLDVTCAA
jgi:hypothetical protein